MSNLQDRGWLCNAQSTVFPLNTVLRLCTINPRTDEAEIRGTIQKLEKFGNILRS